MIKVGEILEVVGNCLTLTGVDEFVGNTSIKVGKVCEDVGDYPTIASVDEFVGNFIVIKVGEILEVAADCPTTTSINEFVGDTSIKAGKAIEVAGNRPTIAGIDEFVDVMVRQLMVRILAYQSLKQLINSVRIFYHLLKSPLTISRNMTSRRILDTRKTFVILCLTRRVPRQVFRVQ